MTHSYRPSHRMRLRGALAALLVLASSPLAGQRAPIAGIAGSTAAIAGSRVALGRKRTDVSAARLARLDTLLDAAVSDGSVTGAVGLVLRDGKVIYERAVGWSDRAGDRRMNTDAIFRIASQTKALTSVSILSLVEQGRLTLDDPVSRFIPSFANTSVLTAGFPQKVPARRAITIRDLLTHTAGISYGTDRQVAEEYRAKQLGPAAGWGWYTADKDEPVCTTMETLGTLPFVQQPGAAWVYGYNTDILGCVVERVSGVSLDEFIRTRITAPLRMADTHFFLPEGQRDRIATVYMSDSTRRSVRAPDGARGQGHYVEGPRRSFSGGAGLLSTAGDYARFLQMLLNGGILDGARILAPRTVELMTTNQVGTLYSTDGRGFGLGFSTVDRLGADGFKSVGSFGWGGAYGSSYTVDPEQRLVIVFMIQQMPNSSDLPSRFTNLVYQALVPRGR
ncbi:MAG: beta-lactamase family protein [Gemmatimonadaceae bacterium]|nr:beta-lactamase family protein [Gemmatimonadaceae bacterium]